MDLNFLIPSFYILSLLTGSTECKAGKPKVCIAVTISTYHPCSFTAYFLSHLLSIELIFKKFDDG